MELIGKGSFTKCYLLPCKKKVLLETDDPVKECIGNGWFPNTPLFPKLETTDKGYLCKYYPKVRSLKKALKPSEYEKYKDLRDIFTNNWGGIKGYSHCRRDLGKVKNKTMRKHLLDAVDSLANYGDDMCFEISPRNVAVNNGKLVLLDCFFMSSRLAETRK